MNIKTILIFALCSTGALAQDAKYMTRQKKSKDGWVNPGWSQEESILAKAIIIRAKALEAKTGISFTDLKLIVSFEWSLGKLPDGTTVDAMYVPEKQAIYFVYRLVSDINVRHKAMLFQMDPEVVAKDDTLGKLIDHELGHAIADVVSRKTHKKPYYTEEQFYALDRAEQIGLKTVSEGIGEYFAHVRSSDKDQGLGPWIVTDIIEKHKERGLAWLVSHPFVPGDDARESAIAHKKRALKELAR